MFIKPRSHGGRSIIGIGAGVCLVWSMKPLKVGWDICLVVPTRQVESGDVFSGKKPRLEEWIRNQSCQDHKQNQAYSTILEKSHCRGSRKR